MIKRVNFTGRRRVPRDRVEIKVFEGQPRRFDATINLDGLRFLPNAAVYLEATCAGSSVIRRFSFGEVGAIQPPTERELADVNGENVFFTLKVVDRAERFGRILGLAEISGLIAQEKKTLRDVAEFSRSIEPISVSNYGSWTSGRMTCF